MPAAEVADRFGYSTASVHQMATLLRKGRLNLFAEARPAPVRAAALPGWPAGEMALPCDHAGLLLLLPAICEVGLPDLVAQAGYPSTRELPAWQSIGTLLLAKCARTPRVSHAGTLADDEGLAFTLGLTALPKTTHLGTYSWRVRRQANQKLLTRPVPALRPPR